jgi:hypothetical protein
MAEVCNRGFVMSEEPMRAMTRFITCAVVAIWPITASTATLSTDEASSHVGETATVCGAVASAHYAAHSRGKPTFLNLDKPYPHEVFTVVIWGSDRTKFGTPETVLSGKQICATGAIQLYRGRPEIILHEPGQMTQK